MEEQQLVPLGLMGPELGQRPAMRLARGQRCAWNRPESSWWRPPIAEDLCIWGRGAERRLESKWAVVVRQQPNPSWLLRTCHFGDWWWNQTWCSVRLVRPHFAKLSTTKQHSFYVDTNAPNSIVFNNFSNFSKRKMVKCNFGSGGTKRVQNTRRKRVNIKKKKIANQNKFTQWWPVWRFW